MAKFSQAADTLYPLVKNVLDSITAFKFQITSGDIEDFYFLWNTGEKSRCKASISLTPKYLVACGAKPLCITVFKKFWDSADTSTRKLLLVHELMHIIINKAGEYKLRQHDVQDFHDILKTAGLDWENVDRVINSN